MTTGVMIARRREKKKEKKKGEEEEEEEEKKKKKTMVSIWRRVLKSSLWKPHSERSEKGKRQRVGVGEVSPGAPSLHIAPLDSSSRRKNAAEEIEGGRPEMQ